MKRKIIKQGNNTLTITLPKNWTEKKNIKAGDEIDLSEFEGGLQLKIEREKVLKSISLNIDDLENLALAKLLIACFEQGYDTITLNFTKQSIKSYNKGSTSVEESINLYVARLIGFEIISQTSHSVTIGNVSEKLTKFDNIVSRIFFLVEEYIRLLILAMKNNDKSELKEGEQRHDNITKFIALASRIISESTSYTKNEALNYFTIFNYMDKVTDFIRYAYKNASRFNKRISKETIELAEKALEFIKLYRHYFYKFSYKYINELDDIRHEIKALYIAYSEKNKESSIASNFDAMAEVLNGIIKSRISLELLKKDIKENPPALEPD